MSQKLKSVILVLVCVVLIFYFTPIFGNLYEHYFGPLGSGFWGPTNPGYFDGFFIACCLFITFFIVLFSQKNKYKKLLIFLGVAFFVELSLKALNTFLVSLTGSVISYLLAELIIHIIPLIKVEKK